jgi:predicted RNA-binding protein with PUA-like domain
MAKSVKSWLVKTEPESFSIQDLARAKGQTTCWSGVRNYQARNLLRDEMQAGEQVLFYHSGGDAPSIVGTATVARAGYPDPTAWNPDDSHYDPKSTKETPRWYAVDLKLEQIFAQPLPLESLRRIPALAQMELLRKGSRLSVQPVRQGELEAVLKLAKVR